MKTTVDLPENLLHRAKVVAAQRKTTVKALIVHGLDLALRSEVGESKHAAAIARLRKGLVMNRVRLTRDQLHERD